MKLTVSNIKHVLTVDIDPNQKVDVQKLDSLVFTCIAAAVDALEDAGPPGFNAFERNHLKLTISGMRHSHISIRNLLKAGAVPSAVDALGIARLQLETLFSICFLLQDPANVRLLLKSGWKKKYTRFLLDREEHVNLKRFNEYFNKTALPFIEELRKMAGVTDDEKITIEHEELGTPLPAGVALAKIEKFPTPAAVISKIKNPDQKSMLERLYPDYQYLCSFVHGDSEVTLFKTALDKRSPYQKTLTSDAIEDFFQRQVAELPVMFSVISSVQVATEVAAFYPGKVELLAKVTEAWNWLVQGTLFASPVWERRAKKLLPLV